MEYLLFEEFRKFAFVRNRDFESKLTVVKFSTFFSYSHFLKGDTGAFLIESSLHSIKRSVLHTSRVGR